MRTIAVTDIKRQESIRRCALAVGCPHHAVDEAYPHSGSWIHHYCTHPDRVKEHPALDNAGLRVCEFVHEGHCPYGAIGAEED